jgi:hypothetical protein
VHRVSFQTRHVRGLAVALTAIALSAGVALAARPSSAPPANAADGLARAAEAAGKTVPVAAQPPTGATDEDEDAGAASAPETEDTAADHPANHGAIVSAAAHGETPAAFANHGAYVSSIAKSDAGKPQAPEAASHGAGAATSTAAKQHKTAH